VYTYLPEQGWGDLNLLATAGAGILVLGVLVFAANVLWSRRRGLVAGVDPWGSGTLEWATASPPPAYNFRRVPTVHGRDPVWDNPPDAPVVAGLAADARETLVTTLHDAAPDHRYHMANDSVFPFLLAAVVAGTLTGFMFHPLAVPIGIALILLVAALWFWPRWDTKPIHHPPAEKGPEAVAPEGDRPPPVPVVAGAIDVSRLPATAFGARAPVWWGNTLMMVSESVSIAVLISCYAYLAVNNPEWPPPRGDRDPPILHPAPDLPPGTANLILILASCLPMYWLDQAARGRGWLARRAGFGPRGENRDRLRRALAAGMAVLTLLGVGSLVLRWYEFPALLFRWDEHAYASIVWSLLFMHLLYLILAVAEAGIVVVWLLLHDLDEKHAVDVTLTAGYWYWTAGVGAVVYAVVYLAPRVL
jgi:heme/copper-type cytochrome/quinol oxidase subunit 3